MAWLITSYDKMLRRLERSFYQASRFSADASFILWKLRAHQQTSRHSVAAGQPLTFPPS
jgi:hypothetical protein